ncbi:MAG: DNA-binding transcriptional repressor AcrR [Methanocella sp. PtaU1.Bin125]|nr:MAG: DNA-binding transcriptional repressor AcrR [Methanocella sp. PtaU1.Bin125]
MSRAERKEREREMRRNEIVDAAEKLFFSRGYENVTMDDIARELEMARATLYLSFRNKEDIYAAVAVRASKIVSRMFGALDREGMTGLEKIRAVGSVYFEFYRQYTGYYMAYYHAGMFDPDGSPEREELKRIRTDSFRMVVEAVKEGVRDGSIRDDVSPEAATLVMLSMSNNALNLSPVTRMYMEKYGLTQEELYEHTMDMMVRSVASAAATPGGNRRTKTWN